MTLINENYQTLAESYLFSNIAKKVAAYTKAHPEAKVISLGIGDVTKPLCPAVIEAMHAAVDEMSKAETFHGYGPEQGYVPSHKSGICFYVIKSGDVSDNPISG